MKEQHYKVLTECFHSGDDVYYADEPCDKPSRPRVPKYQLYCTNQNCEVRETVVTAFYPCGQPPTKPPRMLCTQCCEPLQFDGYLIEVLLVPVEDPSIPPDKTTLLLREILASLDKKKKQAADQE